MLSARRSEMAAVGQGFNEKERRRVIKTLLDAGVHSVREISERSGLSKSTVSRVRHRLLNGGTIEQKIGSGSLQHLSGVALQTILAKNAFLLLPSFLFFFGKAVITLTLVMTQRDELAPAQKWPLRASRPSVRKSSALHLINHVSVPISLLQAVYAYLSIHTYVDTYISVNARVTGQTTAPGGECSIRRERTTTVELMQHRQAHRYEAFKGGCYHWFHGFRGSRSSGNFEFDRKS